MYSSISELDYVDNVKYLDLVILPVLVGNSVSCFMVRKNTILPIRILVNEVIPRAADTMNLLDIDSKMTGEGGGFHGSLVIIGKIQLYSAASTIKNFRNATNLWEWDTGGGQMQESPCPGVIDTIKDIKNTNDDDDRYEWMLMMDMDKGDSMEWMMEERRVRTSLKNVQIYSEMYFSYSIWKLGQDSSSRGLPGRITTNVRKEFKKTNIINNVLLGSLLMLLLTLLLRVKESCPSHKNDDNDDEGVDGVDDVQEDDEQAGTHEGGQHQEAGSLYHCLLSEPPRWSFPK